MIEDDSHTQSSANQQHVHQYTVKESTEMYKHQVQRCLRVGEEWYLSKGRLASASNVAELWGRSIQRPNTDDD
jgi:hypothetical protein